MIRRAVALAFGAVLAVAPPAPAQAPVVLAPFAFDLPPGFARAGSEGAVTLLRDVEGSQITAEVYPGAHPLHGRPVAEITEALERPLAAALLPESFAWLEPPRTELRADGTAVFTALAARRNPRGDAAIQAVIYAIGPEATLHVGLAGIGQPASARATIGAIARSLRAAPPR